ncbi:MAG: hypothetical protein AB7U39_19400 [Ilumatobacteraceae bacterium]
MHTADTLFEPEADGDELFVERVIRAHRARQRPAVRRTVLSAAAAVVLLIGAGWVGIARLTGADAHDHDRLADIAATWEASDGVRFVYQATATVAPTFGVAEPGSELSLLTAMPTCQTNTRPTARSGGVEVGELIDGLLGNDPCAALADIREHVGGTAQQAATALYRTRTAAQADADQIAALTARSPLEQRSLTYLYDTMINERDFADDQLAVLRNAASRTARTLQAVADAADHALPVDPLRETASDDLRALVALVDDTPAPTVPQRSATWEQLATGIWHHTSITVDGVTTAPDGSTDNFTAPTNDQLGLVTAVLGTPEQILHILNSAPNSSGSAITWVVPAGTLSYPGIAEWQATARLDGERLDGLTLNGIAPDGVTVTITVIPER